MPWLTHQFTFARPPIYIVRHPCAVVSSQLKQGGWDQVQDKFDIPYQNHFPEFYVQHEEFLNTISCRVQKLAATRCLKNLAILSNRNNNLNWITITYESLIQEPTKQLERIEKRWNLKFSNEAIVTINKASKTTVKGSPILDGKEGQLSSWKNSLTETQQSEIFEVLQYFEVDLYNQGSLPTKVFVD